MSIQLTLQPREVLLGCAWVAVVLRTTGEERVGRCWVRTPSTAYHGQGEVPCLMCLSVAQVLGCLVPRGAGHLPSGAQGDFFDRWDSFPRRQAICPFPVGKDTCEKQMQ